MTQEKVRNKMQEGMNKVIYFLELLGMFLLGALTGMIHDPECEYCYDMFD